MKRLIATAFVLLITLSGALAQPVDPSSSPATGVTTAASQQQPEGTRIIPPKPPEVFEGGAARLAAVFLLIWVFGIVVYLIWAVNYHVKHWGMSRFWWKLLYPELYEKDAARQAKLLALRDKLVLERRLAVLATPGKTQADADAITTPFDEPKGNAYEDESFGLPPATLRGILALSAVVIFIAIEAVNLVSPTNLEDHFQGAITAVYMVLAFYFGAKAVEVLSTRETHKDRSVTAPTPEREKEVIVVEPAPASAALPVAAAIVAGDGAPATNVASVTVNPPTPADDDEAEMADDDKPPLAEVKTFDRLVNSTENGTTLAQPPEAGADGHESLLMQPLASRILALTASFETGKGFPDCFGTVTGNFDGQGISFGALQFNMGQNTLQPLLRKMNTANDALMQSILEDFYDDIMGMLNLTQAQQMEWATSVQLRKTVNGRKIWVLEKQWKERLEKLGKTDEMIRIQTDAARTRLQVATENCRVFKLTSRRGLALLFDIAVQNGKVNVKGAGDRIFADYGRIDEARSSDEKEVERMKIIAHRRAEVASPRWREDVERRKMTIALGKGEVHGKSYDLVDYGLDLKPFVAELVPA